MLLAVAATLLTACASRHPAPVEDRSSVRTAPIVGGPGVAAPPTQARPEFYAVKPGDTLPGIARTQGVDYRQLIALNGLSETSPQIEVGQILRLRPGAGAPPLPVAVEPPVQVQATSPSGPIEQHTLEGGDNGPPAQPAGPEDKSGAEASASPPSSAPSPGSRAGEVRFIWPVSGRITDRFDAKNKGIDIAAPEGDPVQAAADGSVLYAGSGIRGYGQLLIIKHNDDYLSVYAHNNKLLVRQGDVVKQGQTVAQVGHTDTDRPKLHFEIRRQGTSVDPLQYLPARP